MKAYGNLHRQPHRQHYRTSDVGERLANFAHCPWSPKKHPDKTVGLNSRPSAKRTMRNADRSQKKSTRRKLCDETFSRAAEVLEGDNFA